MPLANKLLPSNSEGGQTKWAENEIRGGLNTSLVHYRGSVHSRLLAIFIGHLEGFPREVSPFNDIVFSVRRRTPVSLISLRVPGSCKEYRD